MRNINPKSPEKYLRSKARNAARRQSRRERAEKRNAEWAALSLVQQIESLLMRPGNSHKQMGKLGFSGKS